MNCSQKPDIVMNQILIHIKRGNILEFRGDCIVNPANSSLTPGKGLDGLIHKAGGSMILQACQKHGNCPPGEAIVTSAGRLPVKYLIHAVGPLWKGGDHNEKGVLKLLYKNSLDLAIQLGVQSIAFPNISTGIFGFPKDIAGDIVLDVVQSLKTTTIKEIHFYCFDDENFSVYQKLFTEKRANSS